MIGCVPPVSLTDVNRVYQFRDCNALLIMIHASSAAESVQTVMRHLQLRFDFDSTAVPLLIDSHYDHSDVTILQQSR